jgi:hypothetical protein
MKKSLLLLLMPFLLCPALPAQRVESNVVAVHFTLVVPETATMNAVVNGDGTATVTVAYNLARAPLRIGVEYDSQVYAAMCPNNEPCHQRDFGTRGEVQIVVQFRPQEIENFQLVLVAG